MFLTLIILTQPALALTKANPKDFAAIENVIQTAKQMDDNIRTSKLLLDKATDPLIVAKYRKRIADAQSKREASYKQALWLTLRAYDIIPFADNVPILEDGVSVIRSPEKGQSLTWLPIFDEIGAKPVQNEFGQLVGVRNVLPNVAGNTASDGISRIFPGAFDSPGELASILIHEKLHFKQNTTPHLGDEMTTAELEVAAYELEEKILVDGDLGLTEDVRLRQAERIATNLHVKRALAKVERAEADKVRGGRPLPEA